MIIHRLYANKQEAQERIKKIKEIGYSRAPKLWDKVDRMYKYKQREVQTIIMTDSADIINII